MSTYAAWKAFERRIARLLGLQRIPVTGLDRHGADFADGMFAYQAKQRGQSAPPSQQLLAWLDGIVGRAQRDGKIGVVIWQRGPRALDREALVVLRLADWVDLHSNRQQAPP